MRVLHITECFEGGVSRAIHSLVNNTPEHNHILLAKGDDAPESDFSAVFSIDIPALRIDRWRRAIAAAVNETRPDVIHAHSSWAGVYTRLGRPARPVVYQPHCFAFDMRTRRAPAYRLAERLLAGSTAAFLTLSEHEAAQARSFGAAAPVLILPNVATLPRLTNPVAGGSRSTAATGASGTAEQTGASGRADATDASGAGTGVRTVVMVGRLCAQKDPALFQALAQAAGPGFRFVWIGDGEAGWRTALEDAGIEVTGWLGAEALAARLQAADAYVHTAAWEGFPLSVLDADACGLPVIARDIPAFAGTQVPVFSTPERGLDVLRRTLAAPSPAPGSQFPDMTAEAQARVLTTAYTAALGAAGTGRADTAAPLTRPAASGPAAGGTAAHGSGVVHVDP